MTEHELILRLAGHFPRHPGQLNGVFTCDAELVPIGGQVWALTTDDFSPEEDRFTSDDPSMLGANLAVATLSDLLACGASPQLFLAAVCLPRGVYAAFAEGVAAGLATVLEEAGCHLCGGDVGTADPWRFCGTALGPVVTGRPLTRIIPAAPQTLWVTGELGDANLAAFLGSATPRFELRLEAAQAIREVATACTDTSGGLLDAAWCLSSVSPRVRLELDLSRVPLCAGLEDLARGGGIPVEAALVGGAGEYELLFTTPADLPAEACAALKGVGATAIGAAVPAEGGGLSVARAGGDLRPLPGPPPCPRAAAGLQEHVGEVLAYASLLTREE